MRGLAQTRNPQSIETATFVRFTGQHKQIYTPNTNQLSVMGQEKIAPGLPEPEEPDTMEPRANPNHDPQSGKFTSGPGSGSAKAGKGSGSRKGKTKYAPSPRRSTKGITVGKKKFAKLCGTLNTQYPGLKEGERRVIRDAKYQYHVTADGYGGMVINRKEKLEG